MPFEVISLADALLPGKYEKAYLVLGGEARKLRDFYTGGGLKKHLSGTEDVEILTLEAFIARANQGQL